MPEVSVIVPAYNASEFIEPCVDSILAQEFRDFEVIIIDDGSSDGTGGLCERLYGKYPSVRLHRHPENKGISPARNTGLSLARGKYAMFVDSDDLILPHALSCLYDAAEKYNADIVSADGYLRSNTTNRRLLTEAVEENPLEKRTGSQAIEEISSLPDDPGERLRMYINYAMLVFSWNRLYSMRFLSSNRLGFPPFRVIGEDLLFHCVCMLYAKTYIRIPDYFYVYCQNPDSIIRSAKPQSWLGHIAESMTLGARYLRENLSRLKFFQDNPSTLDTAIQLFLENFKYEHIMKGGFYAGYSAGKEAEKAVSDSFERLFGEDASFVKYLFNTMNIHFEEARDLVDKNHALERELDNLKRGLNSQS